ncbi:MAG: SRPBCC family protein [Actinomycetota bacterium]|nr:SRPBCC family protein [Actinomycetota bacterium]
MAQRVQESIEVQAPLQDVFTYWSNLENFPRIMRNVEEVRVAGDTSHWRVKGPLGKTVEFDARTTEMRPERGIGWNSTNDNEVETSGQVRFEEVTEGRTRVDVTMNYTDPPGGKIGEVVADAISNPEREMREDLENFARQVERGELNLAGPGTQTR